MYKTLCSEPGNIKKDAQFLLLCSSHYAGGDVPRKMSSMGYCKHQEPMRAQKRGTQTHYEGAAPNIKSWILSMSLPKWGTWYEKRWFPEMTKEPRHSLSIGIDWAAWLSCHLSPPYVTKLSRVCLLVSIWANVLFLLVFLFVKVYLKVRNRTHCQGEILGTLGRGGRWGRIILRSKKSISWILEMVPHGLTPVAPALGLVLQGAGREHR